MFVWLTARQLGTLNKFGDGIELFFLETFVDGFFVRNVFVFDLVAVACVVRTEDVFVGNKLENFRN